MIPRALTVFFERRTWAEFGYALLGLPLGILGFVVTVTTLAVSLGLAVTFVGLPLLAATAYVSRWLAGGMRRLANAATEARIPAPPPMRPSTNRFGRIGSAVRDAVAWRARAYLVLKLPLGILSLVSAAVFWVYGLGLVSYWFWRPYLPCNDSTDGVCHRGANFGSNYTLDTPGRIALTAVAGVLFLLIAPWAVRGTVALDRAAARALLGPHRAPPPVPQVAHLVSGGAR